MSKLWRVVSTPPAVISKTVPQPGKGSAVEIPVTGSCPVEVSVAALNQFDWRIAVAIVVEAVQRG
jgi:hypothetical protein